MVNYFRCIITMFLVLTPALANAADIAIVGAKVYLSPEAVAIPDATVLIHRDRIMAVGPRSKIKIPEHFVSLQATGKVVTAGFWNSHVHLVSSGFLHPESLSNANLTAALQKMFIRWGFTTVFDLASTMQSARAIRNRIDAGAVAGPAILTVGEPFYPPGGTPIYARPIYRDAHLPSAEITSDSEAVARVARQAAEGANGIKLFVGAIVGGKEGVRYMSAGTIRAITQKAHQLGLPTFAHPTDAKGVSLAIENGVDVLAHTDALGGRWSAALVGDLRTKNIGLIPTLMLFEVDPDPRTPVETSIQQLEVQAQSGGDVIFGTDAGFMPVYDPTREYRLMARAVAWKAILASLTTTPARRFGQGNRTGKVQPGFSADLLILSGDPATDVGAFAKVRNVIRRGQLIYSERPQRP